jgi:hypothetical protein
MNIEEIYYAGHLVDGNPAKQRKDTTIVIGTNYSNLLFFFWREKGQLLVHVSEIPSSNLYRSAM